MNRPQKHRKTAINVMIAIVLSLVLNFSYLVFFMMVGSQREPTPSGPKRVATERVVTEESAPKESLTPPEAAKVDSLKRDIIIREESITNRQRHKEEQSPMASRRGRLFMLLDILYYWVVTMVLLTLMTNDRKRRVAFTRRVLEALLVTILGYLLTPQMTWRGDIILTLHAHHLLNPITMLKVLTALITTSMYGKIYELLYAKQRVEMENEVLKNENLTWQYNTLVNQVNPHFLFNSLNSLSMLVRERKEDDAVTYISRMSDTYRYIIEEGKAEKTTVESELRFLEAYRYMLEIRYAGKLQIEVAVAEEYYDCQLPPLSIQPLIENAVKHNTITSALPMHITITSEGDYIIVRNPIHPKLQEEQSTGIGLENLSRRYELVVGRAIEVTNDGKEFIVRLPINKSTK
ncbi:MAG: histidine kinase [Tidjanibacter sp.]|nr:histidine kinase [Tidjanibacter sp.]